LREITERLELETDGRRDRSNAHRDGLCSGTGTTTEATGPLTKVAARNGRIGIWHRNVARIRWVLWQVGILSITVTITVAILTAVTITITVATALAVSTTAITATISITTAIASAVSVTATRLPAGATAIITTAIAIASGLRFGRISSGTDAARRCIADARNALRIQRAGVHAAVVAGVDRASSGAALPAKFLRPSGAQTLEVEGLNNGLIAWNASSPGDAANNG